MNEVVFITDHCHTGHLKAASYELNNRSRDIAEQCVYRIGQVDPVKSPKHISLNLRLAVSRGSLPEKDKEKWQGAEKELVKLMKTAHIMKSLIRAEMRLGEMLQEVPQFLSFQEAFLYFKSTSWRLDYLLSSQARQRLDSARLVSYSFLESWVLRRAIFEGIYFTQPS